MVLRNPYGNVSGTKRIMWYFTVDEDGSFHESPYYTTREQAINSAKKYLKSRHGRYAHSETLRIEKILI